ncbi:MAG: ABC transporter permease [Clostridium sp.]|uniref:ABC transporter permease n=2 Tax=Clostridium sp. TaxID=1506 RepID=UPI0026738CA6|nr:ABC transporter permease [Clostridium sp.]MDD5880012.1 ABC transporter permease [Clostridiales bacterium]MDD7683158.1 ABC transporter permease [Clostridium sp.]MDY2581135.1 ABC transporter permease [Clostridium sp.]
MILLSKTNENMMIISKVTMGVIIGTMQTLLVYVYSSFVLKVNWGENALKYMLLYIALALFASMIGAIVGIVSKNDTAVSGILFVVTFAFSILGGCCSTREMITSIPFINKLAYISPIYWINTAINTMICNFKSNLYIIALLVPVVLSIIIFIIYIIIMKKRGEALDV